MYLKLTHQQISISQITSKPITLWPKKKTLSDKRQQKVTFVNDAKNVPSSEQQATHDLLIGVNMYIIFCSLYFFSLLTHSLYFSRSVSKPQSRYHFSFILWTCLQFTLHLDKKKLPLYFNFHFNYILSLPFSFSHCFFCFGEICVVTQENRLILIFFLLFLWT